MKGPNGLRPSDLARLVRTARHLRPSQILWRAFYQTERRLASSRLVALPRPLDLRIDFPDLPICHRTGPTDQEVVRLAAAGEFEHLNLRRTLGVDRPDWLLGKRDEDRLWAITLHYHAWAFALARQAAVGNKTAPALLEHLLVDWLARCQLGQAGAHDLAWNSFAIATRLYWWSQILRTHPGAAQVASLQGGLIESAFRQANHLASHIEWDLRGNHLIRDVVGLAVAGRLFRGREAQRWLDAATRIAVEQVNEQILPDGWHFERSPMYHIEVMQDVLLLSLLIEEPAAVQHLKRAWSRMAAVLRWLRHPDGQIPLFNDSAFNGTCEPAEMLSRNNWLGVEVDTSQPTGSYWFKDSGFICWHDTPWSVFFDVGKVGPDYQPGHAHADTLSIECSYRGHRLFVDPGTYSYGQGTVRTYDRSTAAHNTVCIDGRDSSEVWGAFRVGRRAIPHRIQMNTDGSKLVAFAAHDGYLHLPGAPQHSRTLEIGSREIRIIDKVEGRYRHRLSGGFLVAPGWSVEEDGHDYLFKGKDQIVHLTFSGPSRLGRGIASMPYHPEFGKELLCPRISWSVETELPFSVETILSGIS